MAGSSRSWGCCRAIPSPCRPRARWGHGAGTAHRGGMLPRNDLGKGKSGNNDELSLSRPCEQELLSGERAWSLRWRE